MNMMVLSPQVSFQQTMEGGFKQLADWLRGQCQSHEYFTLLLSSEQSQFTRFNQAKVRQTGVVWDGHLRLTLMQAGRSSYQEFPLTGNSECDHQQVELALTALRREMPQLPENPYLVIPTGTSQSRSVYPGDLLLPEKLAATLLPEVADLDFAGIYAAGTAIRAYADSAGQHHWFATDVYALDYSVFSPDGQAVKGTLAGSHWDQAAYQAQMQTSRQLLSQLAQPAKPIGRGQYRTYLAPAAMAEIIYMLSWDGMSEASFQQGGSCFGALRRGERQLSPKFTLRENFASGLVPPFNELGEVAPSILPLITAGQLDNLLISSATAKEYQMMANGANQEESLRSPEIGSGDLPSAEILAALDTGLYVSNLHYLNWSDRPVGRITGMTRYACFWVEGGEIVAPIANLRFDDSIYQFWGDNLLALTDFQEFIPEVGTYGHRSLGGMLTPGALIEGFTYTL
jgi:predicted Zn-dependent protease